MSDKPKYHFRLNRTHRIRIFYQFDVKCTPKKIGLKKLSIMYHVSTKYINLYKFAIYIIFLINKGYVYYL